MSDEMKQDHTSTAATSGAGTPKDTTTTASMASATSTSPAAGSTGGFGSRSESDATASSMASSSNDDKSAKDMAWETKEAAQGRAQDLAGQAKAEVAALGENAKQTAYAKAEEAKGRGASEVERTAENIRNAGREFGEDSYAYQAADYLATSLHDAADAIRTRDVSTVMDDVTHFARRNPAVFLGGAAMLGFFAARMLKASERARHTTDYDYGGDYGQRRYGGDYDAAPTPGVGHTPHAAKTAAPTYPATTTTGASGGMNGSASGTTTMPSTARTTGGLS